MTIIDLKSHPFLRKIFGKTLWGYTDVRRTIDFQAGYGPYATTSLSPLRSKIQGRFQRQNLFMSRSVSLYGIRSAYSSREFARYRNLPAIPKQEAVSYGHSRQGFKINPCRSQRKTRLAYLCRICPKLNQYRKRAIQRRLVSRRVRTRPYMPWMQQLSIYACQYFPGHLFEKTKLPSSSIHCWI